MNLGEGSEVSIRFRTMQKKKEKKLDHLLTLYTRMNSKWVKEINVRLKTIKKLEENIDSKISDTSYSNCFLIYFLWQGKQKKKINKWNYIKLKSFCRAEEIINKIERKPTEWENIFANDACVKGLISKIYKELTKLNTKNPNNPIKKIGKSPDTSLKSIQRWPIDI